MAVVDKKALKVESIYLAEPIKVVRLLKKKLLEKAKRYKASGKEIRRTQASLSGKDLRTIRATQIFPVVIPPEALPVDKLEREAKAPQLK